MRHEIRSAKNVVRIFVVHVPGREPGTDEVYPGGRPWIITADASRMRGSVPRSFRGGS